MEESVEARHVAVRGLSIRFHFFRREEQAEHAAHAIHAERNAGFDRDGAQTVGEQYRLAFEVGVKIRRLDNVEHRQARRHRNRIARQRAGLIDRSRRRDFFHDVATSAVRADRHAAADDLAERRQVRRDAVQRLRAAERDAEAGHHFVENQQRAVLRAQLAQTGEIAVARRDAIHVAGDGLDDETGDAVADLVEQFARGVEVVVGQCEREIGERFRYAGRRRHAEGQRAGTGLDQKRVAVAVIAAFEFDDRCRGR